MTHQCVSSFAGVSGPTASVPQRIEAVGSEAVGYIVAYVDDFLIVGADPFIDAAAARINEKWKIAGKPTLQLGGGKSVEYLSDDIAAEAAGYFLSQPV